MKRIIFPCTSRVHKARQRLLLDELQKDFDVVIWEPTKSGQNLAVSAIFYSIEFNNYINSNKFDYALIRGDRYELLPIAAACAYKEIPIIHIEGGDLSGVIDNKIRHAISQLSDYHFCTNEESHKRLISMGISPNNVFNYGSLDVEFAKSVEVKKLRENPYIFVAHHPIVGEDEGEITKALEPFSNYEVVKIESNKDYGKQYGNEMYSPEDYVNLMRGATCLVGNSSSLLKEASILGVPVVNVGNRQRDRLKPRNVLDIPCEAEAIKEAIQFQSKRRFEPDFLYFQENTSKKIAIKLKDIL